MKIYKLYLRIANIDILYINNIQTIKIYNNIQTIKIYNNMKIYKSILYIYIKNI
jgi:hypothetical protein